MDILCWNCGKVADRTKPHLYYSEELKAFDEYYLTKEVHPWYRCYCEECYEKVKEQEEHDLKEYIRLKKKMMYNRALNILEKQSVRMYNYKDAIEVVEEHITEHPDKYDSAYEVIAAIILVHNRIVSKMQYKVGRYQVDFLLPELGVALEIDGDRHKYKKDHDRERDRYIKNQLGCGWDIVRINTDYLDEKATKLIDAINAVVEYRETNHIPWRKIYK